MKRLRKAVTLCLSLTLMLSLAMPVSAATKQFEIGKLDPKEVVATVDSTAKTVTLSMDYVYEPLGSSEELPNPGYMADARQTALLDYMSSNNLTGYKLIIGDGVKGIGANAFASSDAFSSVVCNSNDLVDIGTGAFSNSPNLETVDLESSVITKLEPTLFSDTPVLTEVKLPDTLKTIGSGAFANSGLSTITGGDNVTSVADDAFLGGNSIILDTGSAAIKNFDWVGKGYTSITLGDGTSMFIVTFDTGLPGYGVPKALVPDGGNVTHPIMSDADNTFIGWYSDVARTTPFSFETPITANITLYGKWHANNVNITFEANNGTTATTVKIAYGGKVEKPEDPTYGDQVFAGWFKDTGLTTAVDFDNDVFDKDTTLYAKYVPATYYNVTFDTDGGNTLDGQSIKAGNKVSRPTDPTKEDYTFDGWYTSKEYKTAWKWDEDVVTKDITLYAKWKSNYVTVKFDTQGAGNIESQLVERGSQAKRPGDLTKENCEFLGWFTDSSASTVFNFESKVTEDITIYAGWHQTAFTVKFESNGGSAVASVVANPNTLIAKPADPTKEGYHLEAWCTDSDLTTAWNFDTSQVKGDITLYAKWAPGSAPGVSNTGAAIPQTSDPTSAAPVAGTLFSTLGAAIIGKKKRFF